MHRTSSIIAGFAAMAAILGPSGLQAQEQRGVQHVTPDAVAFRPFPEEPGARIAILYGNPAEAGHYLVRFEFPSHWNGRPHEHGGVELLTGRSGTCYFAHGDYLTREAAQELASGSFMIYPAGTAMRGFAGEEGCVVEVQGQGPFTTQYLDEGGTRR